MTSRDFCYWLQGLFELAPDLEVMDKRQVDLVRRHLNLVFMHEIDPSVPDPIGVLQAAHDGKRVLTEDDRKELEKMIHDKETVVIHDQSYGDKKIRC